MSGFQINFRIIKSIFWESFKTFQTFEVFWKEELLILILTYRKFLRMRKLFTLKKLFYHFSPKSNWNSVPNNRRISNFKNWRKRTFRAQFNSHILQLDVSKNAKTNTVTDNKDRCWIFKNLKKPELFRFFIQFYNLTLLKTLK